LQAPEQLVAVGHSSGTVTVTSLLVPGFHSRVKLGVFNCVTGPCA
jgi:hypothetical protein